MMRKRMIIPKPAIETATKKLLENEGLKGYSRQIKLAAGSRFARALLEKRVSPAEILQKLASQLGAEEADIIARNLRILAPRKFEPVQRKDLAEAIRLKNRMIVSMTNEEFRRLDPGLREKALEQLANVRPEILVALRARSPLIYEHLLKVKERVERERDIVEEQGAAKK